MNFARAKLAKGSPILGLWSLVPHPAVHEMAALAGFDFQILDMEHGPHDFVTLDVGIRTCEGAGCSPWVRIDGLDPVSTQRALDLGAHGVLFPQVRNYEEAVRAVALTKYPPAGVRGFNPFTRVSEYALPGRPQNRNQDGFAMAGLLIENKTAWEDLPKILQIPGLDLVYLGVYDMSVALGKPGDMTNPELLSFLHATIPQARKAGKSVAAMVKTKAEAQDLMSRGVDVVVYGVDTLLVGRAFASAVSDFKEVAKL